MRDDTGPRFYTIPLNNVYIRDISRNMTKTWETSQSVELISIVLSSDAYLNVVDILIDLIVRAFRESIAKTKHCHRGHQTFLQLSNWNDPR